MNNLDSNQRFKEPSEAEKYPKKNLQTNIHLYDRLPDDQRVNLPSEPSSQGALAKQLNQEHRVMQPNLDPTPHIPQIFVSSQLGERQHENIGMFKYHT